MIHPDREHLIQNEELIRAPNHRRAPDNLLEGARNSYNRRRHHPQPPSLSPPTPSTTHQPESKKTPGNMSQRISERESAKEFWSRHKQDYLSTRSIKEVFSAYKQYTLDNNLPLLNEYLFRTFIRKNGYCNSIADKDKPIVEAKKQAKKDAREARKEWLKNMTPEEKEKYERERAQIRSQRREARKSQKIEKKKQLRRR